MGQSIPPKQFSAPGVVLSPDQQQNVVTPNAALPNQPLNPFLQLNMPNNSVAAPNATASPVAGVNNNPNARQPLGYNSPGGVQNGAARQQFFRYQ